MVGHTTRTTQVNFLTAHTTHTLIIIRQGASLIILRTSAGGIITRHPCERIGVEVTGRTASAECAAYGLVCIGKSESDRLEIVEIREAVWRERCC